jgi:putative ABC transport system ATP-binding protein
MNESPFIRTVQLRKNFRMGQNTVQALAGLDLSIPRGSFTIVMGPSGSGKSTLLYLVGGLDRPTAGKILVDNTALDEMDENALAVYRRKKVGFVFQSFNLVQSMNAFENVAFPMRFAGIPRKERKTISSKLLKQVGLEQRAHHKPTELSGGQQQRVAIARSLVNDPELILADEPTGNLDSSSGLGIMQLLSELHQQGKTVLVVTHDPRMQHFATNTIYLLDGISVDAATYESKAESAFQTMVTS